MNCSRLFFLTLLCIAQGAAATGFAQSSSLYSAASGDVGAAPLTLQNSSWYYRHLPPPKQLRVNDLVTIRVDVKSETTSEGESQRRRNLQYDAILRDWLTLRGLDTIAPDPQSAGDPRLRGTITELFRTEGTVESTESVKFDITATIADIRPNGTLVLEAHKSIQVNDMTWDYSLAGICRTDDIRPDNVILSTHIAELSVYKRERGMVRDSYRRGWLLTFWDRVRAF